MTTRQIDGRQLPLNEEPLSDFFENAPVGLFWVAADGLILRANRAELALLGYSTGEFVGHNVAEFHTGQQALEGFLRKLSEGRSIHNHESRLRCRNGSLKVVLISSSVFREGGRIVHNRCFTLDITQQKQAEASLRESEQFNRSIIESSPDCIQALSRDGALLWTNGIGRKIFYGYGDGHEPCRPWIEFWEGDDQRVARVAIASAANGATERFIGRSKATRESRWWDVLITPVLNPAGLTEYLLAVSRDFTARRQDEEARSRLAAVVESSDDAILSMTLEAVVTTWNRGAELMFGYEEEEIVGKSVTVLIPEGREDEEPEILERLKRGERIHHYETLRRRKDGSCVHVSLSVSPILDFNGKIIGASKISRDISGRKSAEEELSRHAANLEKQVAERTAHLNRSVQSLEGVCYSIAHDLRSPLRAMQGFTTILLEEYAPAFDQRGRDFAGRIVRGAARMDALIHDLLDYAKLSHSEVHCVGLDLNAVIEKVLRNLVLDLDARSATIIVSEHLGTVCANQALLEQILTNLFGNALKFVETGVAPRIEVTAEKRDRFLRLLIRDNGIGIASEYRGRVFEMFQRLHIDEKKYPGTGVGLAIVKRGMERMGGMVGIDPGESSGSCFYLDFRAAG